MKWRRILAAALVCMMAVVIPTVSEAAARDDATVSPRYNYTLFVEADLEIDSSGNAACIGGVKTYNASTISLTVTLYKQTPASWSKVDSWSDSVTGGTKLIVEGNCKLSEAGTYKTVVTGTVKGADGGAEWITERSNLVTYP